MTPEWTVTNLIIQIITGFLGANAAAAAAHEHRFGFVGHSLVGLAAGAVSGLFLQKTVMTTVFANGEAMPISGFGAWIYQAGSGAVVGGIAMMVVGLILNEMKKT